MLLAATLSLAVEDTKNGTFKKMKTGKGKGTQKERAKARSKTFPGIAKQWQSSGQALQMINGSLTVMSKSRVQNTNFKER